ncbi:MAG: hypothetical protein RSE41_00300 [Clostridia bacterium]
MRSILVYLTFAILFFVPVFMVKQDLNNTVEVHEEETKSLCEVIDKYKIMESHGRRNKFDYVITLVHNNKQFDCYVSPVNYTELKIGDTIEVNLRKSHYFNVKNL